MNPKFKPMLACECSDLSQVKFPIMASSKLDGIRCTIFGGVAYSRSLKPIPNKFVQSWAKENAWNLEGFDGELILGNPNEEAVFNRTTSFVMSHDKVEDFSFWVFDLVTEDTSKTRQEALESIFSSKVIPRCQLLKQTLVNSPEELEAFEEKQLQEGFEGTMLKDPQGLYKFGRSTIKGGQLLKRKVFVDSEFEVVGYEPKYHNTNEATTNELGRTERSSSKEGLVALEQLGSLTLKTAEGKVFSVGSGFDDAMRNQFWSEKETLIGKYAKVKYFPIGMLYGIPRLPIFLGFRDEIDMGG